MPLCALAALLLLAQGPQQPPKMDVRGRVVDVLGEPIPSAAVWVTVEPSHRELARGRTDGSGVFLLQALREPLLTVHASAPGRAPGKYGCGASWLGFEESRNELTLRDAGTIRGVVVDAQGRPVAAAHVRVEGLDDVLATTGSDGRFEFAEVPLGALRVTAVNAIGTGSTEAWLRDQADVRVALADAGPPIRVRIRGLPAAAMPDCVVTYQSDGGEQMEPSPPCPRELPPGQLQPVFRYQPPSELQRPAAGGDTFVLLGLGKHGVDLNCWCKGYVFTPARCHVAADGSHDVGVQAKRMEGPTAWMVVQGKLRQDDGRPLARQKLSGRTGGEEASAVTGADGSFQLCLPCKEGDTIAFSLANKHWLLDSDDGAGTKPLGMGNHDCTMQKGRVFDLWATEAVGSWSPADTRGRERRGRLRPGRD
jgi:Carboxypeptidase regulatory-like domain